MGRDDVLHRAEHGFDTTRITLIPVAQHVANYLTLQVRLRAAQVTWNDRERFRLRKTLNVFFAAVGERADHNVLAVIAHQLRRHAFHLAAVEHVQEQRLQDIVAVMAQRNFGRAQLRRGTIQNAAAQARAE